MTRVREETDRERIYRFAAERVAAGERVYVVVPTIDEGERDVAATSETAARVAAFAPQANVGILHGRLPPAARDQVLRDFSAGRIGILVSTTVIEVGVRRLPPIHEGLRRAQRITAGHGGGRYQRFDQ